MEGYSKKEFSTFTMDEEDEDEEEWDENKKKVKYTILKEEDFIDEDDDT